MQLRVIFFFLASVLISGFCFALDLNAAKSQGLVGEQADGYLGAVRQAPQIDALVKQVNEQRQEAYARIAYKNGTSADKVARLAGKKLFKKAAASDYLRKPDGVWVLKSQVKQDN